MVEPTLHARPRPAGDAIAPTADLVPPRPEPRAENLGLWRLLATIWRNPLEAWTRRHFDEWIVTETSIPGEIVVVNQPEAIRRILLDHAENYQKGRLQQRILGSSMRNGLLMAEEGRWRAQRRALASVFSARAVAGFAGPMQAAIDQLIGRWRGYGDGAVVDVAHEMAGLTLDVLTRTIFSDGFGGERDDVRRNMRLYFDEIGRIDALDIFGLPDFIPRLGRLRTRGAEAFFHHSVTRLIAARRRLAASGGALADDLLGLLIAARDPVSGEGLSEPEIRANLITFIAAGHETTANALTWAIFLLSLSQPWRARVEAEAGAAGDGPDRLVVTRAVIEEALRLYPPLAAISREARAPDELAGHRIGKGAVVVIAPYVLHRHRLLWQRPDAFDPARFLPGAREAIPRYSYLPFGAGPRVCIGAAFALQEATLALAAITRAFRLEPAPDARIWPMLRLTLRPRDGLPMILRLRAPG